MDDSKNQTGNARLLNMPGRRDQMLRTMLLCALTAAIFFLQTCPAARRAIAAKYRHQLGTTGAG